MDVTHLECFVIFRIYCFRLLKLPFLQFIQFTPFTQIMPSHARVLTGHPRHQKLATGKHVLDLVISHRYNEHKGFLKNQLYKYIDGSIHNHESKCLLLS